MTRDAAICAIIDERLRQEALKAAGKFEYTCADDVFDTYKAVILGEEYGEVCRAICERHKDSWKKDNLRDELTQVAAVCLAWLESL